MNDQAYVGIEQGVQLTEFGSGLPYGENKLWISGCS